MIRLLMNRLLFYAYLFVVEYTSECSVITEELTQLVRCFFIANNRKVSIISLNSTVRKHIIF